jgi:ABC-type Fe3+ transport system permease subunit
MSSLLYSYDNQTLAVAVLNQQELGQVGTTAALSVLLTGVVLAAALPGWLALRFMSGRRARLTIVPVTRRSAGAEAASVG